MFDLPEKNLQKTALILAAISFALAGIYHFINPDFYKPMMPDYLPAHLTLIYVSGFFEILGGVGLLLAKTRQYAGYGLIALLIAVFPANIHMALNPEEFAHLAPVWGLYLRLPFQILFIAWIYLAIKAPKSTS